MKDNMSPQEPDPGRCLYWKSKLILKKGVNQGKNYVGKT
jgi:hypothetical protein